jgi:hypothetical protein
MNAYETLKSMTEKGELEITYLISPMRTLSGVIGAALQQCNDGYISEPMHPFSRNSLVLLHEPKQKKRKPEREACFL